MNPRETKQQRYFTTLKLVLLGGTMLLVGATIALIMSNIKRERTLEPRMHEVVESCEMEGLVGCEAVRVYDGLTLVEFYVRGTREDQHESTRHQT